VAPATCYVEGGRNRGSGVVIDPSGIVLTSPTACGANSDVVNVLVKGGRSYTGRVMGRLNEHELVLVKIDPKEPLPFVELGDSDAARVGQVCYVFGDCFDSLRNDDQPAMSMGILSGIYEITKKQPGTFYTGKVLETSAAVNPNQDGGPLVDREGRLLGIVTLNYEESKFTGLAVPVSVLKPGIAQIRHDFEHPEAKAAPKPAPRPDPAAKARSSDVWFGAEVKAVTGGLELTRIARKGPAFRAGLQRGDVLTTLDSSRMLTEAALQKVLAGKSPGDLVEAVVLRDGEKKELRVTLGSKPQY
ncbi:MAG TPA: S1C family serine protease, partial [Planctomycetota bacterium]|nr:S1C family serine protease [Planctomycetota bacterium]